MSEATAPGMSDAAVRKRTGKDWAEWFALLDSAGCAALDHKGIVAKVDAAGGGDWWSQMITVAYERARGLRVKHQKTDGFSVSASRTLPVSAATVFARWKDARKRKSWLPDPLTITTATAAKSLRIAWGDGATRVEVNLYEKGPQKCQVSVEHNKLADAAAAERMKAFWGEALDRLKATLAG